MIPVAHDLSLILQPRASCEQCSWSVGPSAQAEDRALHHSKQRGHRVRVVTEHIEFYQPVKDIP